MIGRFLIGMLGVMFCCGFTYGFRIIDKDTREIMMMGDRITDETHCLYPAFMLSNEEGISFGLVDGDTYYVGGVYHTVGYGNVGAGLCLGHPVGEGFLNLIRSPITLKKTLLGIGGESTGFVSASIQSRNWYGTFRGRATTIGPSPSCTATKRGDIDYGAVTVTETNGKLAQTEIELKCTQDATVKVQFMSAAGTGTTQLANGLTVTYQVGVWPGVGGFTYRLQGGIPSLAKATTVLGGSIPPSAGPFSTTGVVRLSYE